MIATRWMKQCAKKSEPILILELYLIFPAEYQYEVEWKLQLCNSSLGH
jgi:hypothetical protein